MVYIMFYKKNKSFLCGINTICHSEARYNFMVMLLLLSVLKVYIYSEQGYYAERLKIIHLVT